MSEDTLVVGGLENVTAPVVENPVEEGSPVEPPVLVSPSVEPSVCDVERPVIVPIHETVDGQIVPPTILE